MKVAFIGAGKMGRRMIEKLVSHGHEVVAWDISPTVRQELSGSARRTEEKLTVVDTLSELVPKLTNPRVFWTMLPAGEPTEDILAQLADKVARRDILIDGGNSNYHDTEKRYRTLRHRGIRFLGIGVSGGIVAEREGYPMMVGGDESAYEHVRPILDSLAEPGGGHSFFGEGGAGHFVKMVHNGIEYGIMQSLGEGFEVLHEAPYQFDLAQIARLYQKGTLVSGFMLDRTVEVLAADPTLDNVKGAIAESGEADWMVKQARNEHVRVDIIRRSLEYRRKSQTDETIQGSFCAKLVASLRNAFGGHQLLRTP